MHWYLKAKEDMKENSDLVLVSSSLHVVLWQLRLYGYPVAGDILLVSAIPRIHSTSPPCSGNNNTTTNPQL
jgi:hypothetical protein